MGVVGPLTKKRPRSHRGLKRREMDLGCITLPDINLVVTLEPPCQLSLQCYFMFRDAVTNYSFLFE